MSVIIKLRTLIYVFFLPAMMTRLAVEPKYAALFNAQT